MWPGGKIPYTYHNTIVGRGLKHLVEKAIKNLEEVSCLEFQDISSFMEKYLKKFEKEINLRDYFERRILPREYPDFL